jgi:hypothetical protein
MFDDALFTIPPQNPAQPHLVDLLDIDPESAAPRPRAKRDVARTERTRACARFRDACSSIPSAFGIAAAALYDAAYYAYVNFEKQDEPLLETRRKSRR